MKILQSTLANHHIRFCALSIVTLALLASLATLLMASQKTSAVIPNNNQLVDLATGTSSPATGNGHTPSISGDGRFISFTSTAALTAIDTNNTVDTYVRDTLNNTTQLVSINNAGTNSGDLYSENLSITPNGRYVLFRSNARNLLATSFPTYVFRLYLRDLHTNTTILATPTHNPTSDQNIPTSSISWGDVDASGRFIVFNTTATNMVSSDTNGFSDVFIRDVGTQTTRIVSSSPSLSQANGLSSEAHISCDGGTVLFGSNASNLTTQTDTNNRYDTFVASMVGNTPYITNVSLSANATVDPSELSCDGQTATVTSQATNISEDTPTGTNLLTLYAYQINDSLFERVNKSTDGNIDNRITEDTSSISGDGRFVTFTSTSPTLVEDDSGSSYDIFIRDRQKGTTHRLAKRQNGSQIQLEVIMPAVSSNGHYFTFVSNDTLIVPTQTGGQHVYKASTGSELWEL